MLLFLESRTSATARACERRCAARPHGGRAGSRPLHFSPFLTFTLFYDKLLPPYSGAAWAGARSLMANTTQLGALTVNTTSHCPSRWRPS